MTLLFRTDASVAIGTGHAMRCLALAQAAQDGGERAVFAMSESTASIRTRLDSEACEVFPVTSPVGTLDDANQTIDLARLHGAEWIVIDGYQFEAEYQRAIKAAELKVLFLDDYGHARHYSADVVLNHNVCADEARYANREAYTKLLLGPRYCLLRREFGRWREWKRRISPKVEQLLVMMGGSDQENITARVVEAIGMAGPAVDSSLQVTLVVGGSNPHYDSLKSTASKSPTKIKIERDALNIPELMAAADIAVSAAGSTCWELCLLALPALLLDVAPNQTELARELDRRGCAIHVGGHDAPAQEIGSQIERLVCSSEVRQTLSQRSRELVDGNGARRVISALDGPASTEHELHLRRARPEDMQILWEWANDPEVRAASFSQEPIPWERHVQWFAEKMDAARSLLFIAEDDAGTPYGQIRFDLQQEEAVLNISLEKEKRGRGRGLQLIEKGIRELFASSNCARVHAFVKPDNKASVSAFLKAAFVCLRLEEVHGNPALHFVLDRK